MFYLTKTPSDKSVTLTLFVYGSVIALIKLLASGVTFHGITLGTFTGTDFAAVTGALGAIYAARRHKPAKLESKDKSD